MLTLDFLFDQLDELFEKGDNVDLTVSACPCSSFEYVFFVGAVWARQWVLVDAGSWVLGAVMLACARIGTKCMPGDW